MKQGILFLSPSEVAVEDLARSPDSTVAVSFGDRPAYVPGRRSWVQYRELGVSEASAGAMRAQVIVAREGDNQPTGWHLHRCDLQFLYVLEGAIHIAFSPQRVIRLQAGDSIVIPGGTMHMEMGEPDGAQVLEVSVPADMGTETCVPPWADQKIDLTKATRSDGSAPERINGI